MTVSKYTNPFLPNVNFWSSLFGFLMFSGRSKVNQFHASVLFLYLLKTSESIRFPNVFRGCGNVTLARNALTKVCLDLENLSFNNLPSFRLEVTRFDFFFFFFRAAFSFCFKWKLLFILLHSFLFSKFRYMT